VTNLPDIVSPEVWLEARMRLLAREKALTRARDEVNTARRQLPMVRATKGYTFESPEGEVGLLDLLDGRPQLVMHHFISGRTGTRAARAARLPPTASDACGSCGCATLPRRRAADRGRLRPRVNPGQVGVAAVGARRRHHAAGRRERAPLGGPGRDRLARTQRGLHPHRRRRRAAGGDAWADRRRVRPPRIPAG